MRNNMSTNKNISNAEQNNMIRKPYQVCILDNEMVKYFMYELSACQFVVELVKISLIIRPWHVVVSPWACTRLQTVES